MSPPTFPWGSTGIKVSARAEQRPCLSSFPARFWEGSPDPSSACSGLQVPVPAPLAWPRPGREEAGGREQEGGLGSPAYTPGCTWTSLFRWTPGKVPGVPGPQANLGEQRCASQGCGAVGARFGLPRLSKPQSFGAPGTLWNISFMKHLGRSCYEDVPLSAASWAPGCPALSNTEWGWQGEGC